MPLKHKQDITVTSKKRTSTQTAIATPGAVPDTMQPNLSRLHDLTGLVLVSLPTELQGIIGEEAHQRCIADIQGCEMVLIVREPNDVVYIRLPLVVLSPPPTGIALSADGRLNFIPPAKSKVPKKTLQKPVPATAKPARLSPQTAGKPVRRIRSQG